MNSDKNNPSTWKKYKPEMCNTCVGTCCSMPCEMTISDLVRMEFIDEFEAEENPKKIAKKLKKMRVIEHFNLKNQLYTLQRLSSGDCMFLDQKLRRCTVYDKRPTTCREHPIVSSRPNYCPYNEK
jgi:Fe-S-cluster containining protein